MPRAAELGCTAEGCDIPGPALDVRGVWYPLAPARLPVDGTTPCRLAAVPLISGMCCVAGPFRRDSCGAYSGWTSPQMLGGTVAASDAAGGTRFLFFFPFFFAVGFS
jgi:hypothetical protein